MRVVAGRTIAGRAVTERERPLSGATIALRSASMRQAIDVVADERGEFRVGAAKDEPLTVRAHDAQRGESAAVIVSAGEAPPALRLVVPE